MILGLDLPHGDPQANGTNWAHELVQLDVETVVRGNIS